MSVSFIKVGTAWKTYSQWINVSGTWKRCAVWKKVGDTWWNVVPGPSVSGMPSSGAYSTDDTSPYNANSTFELNPSGWATLSVSPAGFTDPYATWMWLPSGSASSYEARATIVSGTLSSGTAGTWLNLGTLRQWVRNRSTLGTSTVILDVTIRDVATAGAITNMTGRITLSSEGFDPS